MHERIGENEAGAADEAEGDWPAEAGDYEGEEEGQASRLFVMPLLCDAEGASEDGETAYASLPDFNTEVSAFSDTEYASGLRADDRGS